jgi:hypothetical protein
MTTPTRRAWKPRHPVGLLVLVLVGAAAITIGWTRVSMSSSFCASCHGMEPSVASVAGTLHEDLPCLSCHTGSGAVGAFRYLPSFLREGIAEVTGATMPSQALAAVPCATCHDSFRSTELFEGAEHPASDSDCASCHGETAHLVADRGPPDDEHPPRYDQTHGRDAVTDPGTCLDCHEDTDFCAACHVRGDFPHPDGWIPEHGLAAQTEEDAEACVRCHEPRTFCAGCHGTEVPHQDGWVQVHSRVARDVGDASCSTCHAPRDCASCHVPHDIHREQRLYGVGP